MFHILINRRKAHTDEVWYEIIETPPLTYTQVIMHLECMKSFICETYELKIEILPAI
jgi:hypothetical protein